jgi:hypothetical protein
VKYLNKQIKEDIIVIDVMCDHITARLIDWQQVKSMKGERKLIGILKQAVSLLRNSLNKYLAQYSDEEKNQIINKKSQNELFILPKNSFRNEAELMHHQLTQEQANEIAEGIIEGFCKDCKCTSYRECTKRELMMNWLIPGLEETEGCQYKY